MYLVRIIATIFFISINTIYFVLSLRSWLLFRTAPMYNEKLMQNNNAKLQ